MAKRKDSRVELINDLKKGKLSEFNARGHLKYEVQADKREYVYNKLPKRIQDSIYSSPFPKDYDVICKFPPVKSTENLLFLELRWQFDLMIQFAQKIEHLIFLSRAIENAMFNSDHASGWTKLDELERDISVSYYGLQMEFYLNEMTGEPEVNKEILAEFLEIKDFSQKFLVLSELARIREERNLSAFVYDSYVQQHLEQYTETEADAISYIRFKLDPINFDRIDGNYLYAINYDSDLPLIDRYFTLKKLLPSILIGSFIKDEERVRAFIYVQKLAGLINDPYWKNFDLLCEYPEPVKYEPDLLYYQIQDHYFLGEYEQVIHKCVEAFGIDATQSELYIFFVHSLIFKGRKLEDFLKTKTELFEILSLMIRLLEKSSSYNSDRESLMKKYHTISHFNYSYPILEFLYNEYRLSVPKNIYALAQLHSKGLKYNFYKLITNKTKQLEVIKALFLPSFDFTRALIENKGQLNALSFLQQKLVVGYLISTDQYEMALEKLLHFGLQDSKIEFVQTWSLRNFLKCYLKLGYYDKAANEITDYYLRKKYAYDHFIDETLFEVLAEMTDQFSDNIANAVLFQIYNQSQSLIYDTIANFLILNKVKKPSQLLPNAANWNYDKFLFFIEKCCTKDNIEDSPYLFTIEELEEERIILLNFLKDFNPVGEERYNAEILKITKEASIRKGLLQIHESRIYVDEKGISVALELDFPELFDRYIELTDISHIDISSFKFNDENNRNEIPTAYYIKTPKNSETETIEPEDIEHVPQIRFNYFRNLFETITYQFVFSEDYGFKSFLSMRIRHGTFSNILRSVYEKYFLISSKEVRTDSYQDIAYWNDKLNVENPEEIKKLQDILRNFSRTIDEEVDRGLSWLSINNPNGLFNFIFSPEELSNLFINRLGRIAEYHQFVTEIFKVLFERLEENLSTIRARIVNELSPRLIEMLEDLQKEIYALKLKGVDLSLIDNSILDCKTEIQVVSSNIVNWFKISKNQYIEEFPIDLILQASLDYVNNINRNAINNGQLKVTNDCQIRFKGAFFETFGDIFINIFENVVSKNKQLEEELSIHIKIACNGDLLEIVIANNLLPDTNYAYLDEKISSTVEKIEAYKINPSANSFERGSGYLKLCKSIAGDLNRKDYEIIPSRADNNYIVSIKFNISELTK